MSDHPSAKKNPLSQFSRMFYVTNGIELLERGAFYSFSALFTLFMLATFRSSGMTDVAAASLAGTLAAVLFLLLYVVPVLGAPFAEKYGYKASLALVFALLGAGYAVTFFATGVTMIVLAVILIGVGAGIFKPIPAAVVSQTSTTEQRTLAFSIYYACINIGAFVFPVGLGLIAALNGWSPAQQFQVTFTTSALLVAGALAVSMLVFKNINPARRDVSFVNSVRSLGDVFRYPSFLVLMAIYMGFWFMYVLSLTFLSAYMVDFGRMPGWFNASLLQAINPLVIIVLAPFSGIVSRRVEPIPLMVGGIILYALGLVTLGFSSTNLLFVVGVVLFSIGELLTHPSYLAYVSRIAPPDKVSIFLGYGFLPIGFGQFFGAKIGGDLYGRIALAGGAPRTFWAIMAVVGLVTAAALAVYSILLTRSQHRAVAPGPERAPTRRGFPMGAVLAVAAILLVPAVLAGATVGPAQQRITQASADGAGVTPLAASSLATIKLADDAQKLACKKEFTKKVTLPANATGEAVFGITWKTPAPQSPATATTPDKFEIHVTPPMGDMRMTPPETKGSSELKLPAAPGDYTVTVKLTDCGGEAPIIPFNPTGAGASQRSDGSFVLAGSYQVPK